MIWPFILLGVVLIIGMIHIASAIRLRRALTLVRVTYKNPRIPKAFDGYRVGFVSDLHLRKGRDDERAKEIVRVLNEEKLDLLLLGGDFGPDMDRSVGLMDEIAAKDGTYTVYGNHDHSKKRTPLRKALGETNIRLLKNEGTRLGEDFYLTAVDDFKKGKPNIKKALAGANEQDFVLLLAHNPDVMLLLEGDEHIDLMLVGHTHGGQITFFNLFAPINSAKTGNRYRTGFKQYEGEPDVLITNGIGTSRIHLRMFAMPQVHVITLRSEDGNAEIYPEKRA